MKAKIQFGTRTIDFTIEYSERSTLGIMVTPDAEVFVKAPFEASISQIREKLIKRAPWIIKQQSFFLAFQPKTPPRKFISGETHLYLGRQYRLDIETVKTGRETVKLRGPFISVATSDPKKVRSLVNAWYLEKASVKMRQIAQPRIERFKKYGVEPRGIFLRQMARRWGSCTPQGRIILNPELVKAPKGCIEYVIVHELCHLIHLNHTRKFLELQTKEMSDWEKWKTTLEHLLA